MKDALSEGDKLRLYRKNGDIGLLGALYQPYMEMVYALCFKYLRAEEESKDAVMQIFEKLVSDLKNHEVDNFKSWLHSVARNHCLMQLRSRQAVGLPAGLPAGHLLVAAEDVGEIFQNMSVEPDDLSDKLFKDNQLNVMEKCLETLVHEQKLAVELFYKEEKCYKEISVIAGFELGKVKSYIQNGKRNLKICMEKNGSI
ncbi:RNA polymerase sigma factor [Dyadobacter luticola]|nr:sigma-70 family RNA polymerase sigma factor [Dyadobacter luticola]